MKSPYLIDGPQVVSFSGGRTSGFMLWHIVQAHGGTLPEHVKVVFANTGLEHPATLDFVQAVSTNITPVTWIEYRIDEDGKNSFLEVDYTSASRKGEPMETIITKRNYLPNPVSRFCTSETKIRPISKYIKATTGWDTWTDLIGLRADEPRRVHRLKSDGKRDILCPMYHANHTLKDVLAFWASMPFDLDLPDKDNSYGNCVCCFLKGTPRTLRIMAKEPEQANFWIRMEEKIGATFRKDRAPYRQLLDMATSQQSIKFSDDDLFECNCTD
jgi:3'-phosphoadenosine 5'-phosphosulfate sulfotransferase (PAPS reductase)/FAD synthetase